MSDSDESVESGEVQSSRQEYPSNYNPHNCSRYRFIDNFSEEMSGEQNVVDELAVSTQSGPETSVPPETGRQTSASERSADLLRSIVVEDVFITELCVLSEAETKQCYSDEEYAKLLKSFDEVSFQDSSLCFYFTVVLYNHTFEFI
jgi:hypothetical protein